VLPSGWTSAKRAFVAPMSPIRPTSGTLIEWPPTWRVLLKVWPSLNALEMRRR